jgi:hypothetical protein
MEKYEEEYRGGLLPLPEDMVCSFEVSELALGWGWALGKRRY